jgi:hypothetical protein
MRQRRFRIEYPSRKLGRNKLYTKITTVADIYFKRGFLSARVGVDGQMAMKEVNLETQMFHLKSEV